MKPVLSLQPDGGGDSFQASPTRYHALDAARALAMLLGIVYHWQFISGSGGFMAAGPKGSLDHWLHSFRMPLFFLISGFFANMMLAKYGIWKYLKRRWWRIGMPFFVSLVTFATLQYVQTYLPWTAPPMGRFGDAAPAVPRQAPATPGFGNTPTTTRTAPLLAPAPSPATATKAATEAPTFNFFTFGAPPHPWANWLFAKIHFVVTRADGHTVTLSANHFMLQHLWFLWYLLIFCTLAPIVTRPLSFVLIRGKTPFADRFGSAMLRWNLLPMVLAVVTLPALLCAPGFNWTLTNPAGFLGIFPDIFHQYFVDLPFYFLYFLFGWWFFRFRADLHSVAKPWLFNLCLGIAAFAASQAFYDQYGPPPMPFGPWLGGSAIANPPEASRIIRLLSFGLYALGSAYSGFGLLGLVQRYLDHPMAIARYLTDTMLWIYLVQLALIPYVAPWIDYSHTSWWEATLGGVLLVTAIALAMFELFIRPTPLVYIFGSPGMIKRRKASQVP